MSLTFPPTMTIDEQLKNILGFESIFDDIHLHSSKSEKHPTHYHLSMGTSFSMSQYEVQAIKAKP